MSNSPSYYKVVCENIDLIIFIKAIDEKEELAMFSLVREKIASSDKAIVIHEYKEALCKKLVLDFEVLISEYAPNKDEGETLEYYKDIINTMYSAIVNAYPTLSLEFVCTDINAEKYIAKNSPKKTNDTIKSLVENLKKQVTKELNKATLPAKKKSEFSIKTLDQFTRLEKEMKEMIIGQDHAIEIVIKHLKLISAGLSHSSALFFVGPTGVGKTELSRIIGDNYSGNFFKINCAEYAGAHEYAKLIGSPPGYVGHSDRSILKDKSDVSNRWVFLFDEIEKADAKLADFLLSMLDDGTCTDNLGNVLDFSQSIFIFTSNQGMGDVKYNTLGFVKQKPTKEAINSVIFDSVKKKFSPEFMNRIDDVIFFNSLSKEDVSVIVKNKFLDYPIIPTSELIDFVIEKSYSHEYGARNVARYIKNNIATELADKILLSKTNSSTKFLMDLVDGKPTVIKNQNEEPKIKKITKKKNKKILEANVGGEDTPTSKNEAGGEISGSGMR